MQLVRHVLGHGRPGVAAARLSDKLGPVVDAGLNVRRRARASTVSCRLASRWLTGPMIGRARARYLRCIASAQAVQKVLSVSFWAARAAVCGGRRCRGRRADSLAGRPARPSAERGASRARGDMQRQQRARHARTIDSPAHDST